MVSRGAKPGTGRSGTVVVLLLGILAAAGATLLPLGSHPSFPAGVLWAVLTTVVLVWVPFTLPRSGGDLIMSFAPGPLVFMLLLVDHRTAVAWWLVGVVIGRVSYRGSRNRRSRSLNVATAAISAVPAALLIAGPGRMSTDGVPDVVGLATAIGGLAVFYITYLAVSAWWVAAQRRVRWSEAAASPLTGMSLLLWIGTGSVTYLATIIVGTLPAWTLELLMVPVLIVVVIGRRLVDDDRRRRRSAQLYDSASRFTSLRDVGEVDAVLLDAARGVADDGGVRIEEHEPGPGRWGTALVTAGRTRWLSVPAGTRGWGTGTGAERSALAQLCSLARCAHDRITDADDLRHTADHDPLTQLVNRTVLMRRLSEAVDDGGSGSARGLLLIDLDDFKAVNDSHGHAVGDEFLVEVARRLREAVAPGDVVGRLGGDEFAVLVLGGEHGGLQRCARDVSRALTGRLRAGGLTVGVGASIGVAGWESHDTATVVLSNADVALYTAKRDGRSRVRVFDRGMVDVTTRRLRMESDLARDIDTLAVHYQPVVDLRTGRVDGCEALVRWYRDGRAVPPSVFVPVAEQSGLIEALGRRVLRRVVQDLPVINAAAGRPLSMAVNISASQLADPELADLVRAAVRACEGAALVLEMTERVLVDESEETMSALHRLLATGARLTLDDFGSGYSAIGYLRRLPVNGVKFDRSLVAGVDKYTRSRDLVRGLVALCAAMDITPLAEGVETLAEWATVVELGCVLGQGYAFARPHPLSELTDLLRRHGDDLAVPAPLGVPARR